MNAVGRAWLAVVMLAMALCGPRVARGDDALGTELLERLPRDIVGAFSVDNATKLRASKIGDAVSLWMEEHDALTNSRRAWSLFAKRLGVSEVEAFDGLLGGHAVLAFGKRDARSSLDWMVLTVVEPAMDVRMLRRTQAVPRRIVHGRAVFQLEEESFFVATLPPLADDRGVLALAPAGAEWLLTQTLAVSVGKAKPVSADALKPAPIGAVVRGFWQPQGAEGLFGDIERSLWDEREPMHTLALWAAARESKIEIGLSPTAGGVKPGPKPPEMADGVMLDVTGPGIAIVAGVLERAGLIGLVPDGLTVSRETGELVVRRGPEGVDLGARLPLSSSGASAAFPVGQPSADLGQVRIRELAETEASRAIFGPDALMAWTVLKPAGGPAELVVALTAGPTEATPPPPPDKQPRAQAVEIVIEALDRPSPRTIGLHGSAWPHELWTLLQSTVELPDPRLARTEMAGFASLSALIERARWAIEKGHDGVRGRIVLDLRDPMGQ
ncbi:MAG: hypothetical protein NCW75_13085 [Phycisphaera sp.]|nr:MAG: hypothetical protein NCW75_13085 [Phycisphaera sp.]